MGSSDKVHFDEYAYQNKIKHVIFQNYFAVYAKIISSAWNTSVFLIDGFAGRGHYGNPDEEQAFAGSPILALQALARDAKLASKVQTWFIEKDDEHFANLEQSVKSFLKINNGLNDPILTNGEFVETLQPILDEIESDGNEIKPTLLFVDPCGITGVSLNTISSILKKPRCELLLFFNYDGVSRTMGLLKTDRDTPSLTELFGNSKRVEHLRQIVRSDMKPREKEDAVIGTYIQALREDADAEFVVPFRVEYEHRAATSHYLIHASKHPLPFKIMKDMMWEESRDENREGSLELLQASKGTVHDFFRSDLAEVDQQIIDALDEHGILSVEEIIEEFPENPDNLYSRGCYRRRLLHLEAQAKIVVLDEDQETVLPPETRRKSTDRKTKQKMPTIATRLYVRLS